MFYLRKLMRTYFFLKYVTINYVLIFFYEKSFMKNHFDELNSVITSTSILLTINIDHYEV